MSWLELCGNIASVVGLAISIATLIVAARTQSKVEGARKQLLAKVDSTEASWTASGIETALAELVAYCDAKDWALALDRCNAVLRAIQSLRMSSALDAGQRAAVGERTDDFREVQRAIETKHRRQDKHGLHQNKRAAIREFSEEIAVMRASLSRLIREV